MPDTDRERRKEYMKNFYYKRKDLLLYLIYWVNELEDNCISKKIFKFRNFSDLGNLKKFLNFWKYVRYGKQAVTFIFMTGKYKNMWVS